MVCRTLAQGRSGSVFRTGPQFFDLRPINGQAGTDPPPSDREDPSLVQTRMRPAAARRGQGETNWIAGLLRRVTGRLRVQGPPSRRQIQSRSHILPAGALPSAPKASRFAKNKKCKFNKTKRNCDWPFHAPQAGNAAVKPCRGLPPMRERRFFFLLTWRDALPMMGCQSTSPRKVRKP